MVENNVPPYLPSPGGTAEKGALHLQGRKVTRSPRRKFSRSDPAFRIVFLSSEHENSPV